MQASFRASTFIDSFGIDIHLPILNSSSKAAATLKALDYLGLDTVRSPVGGALLASNSIASKLADAGIQFDILTTGKNTPADTIASIASFATAHPGAVVAIEGPNEINNWPITYAGKTGVQAGIAFMKDVAAAADANTALAGISLYDLTGASVELVGSDASDYSNIHAYPQHGDQPFEMLQASVAQNGVLGKGIVITETGYHNAVASTKWQGVDETTQAKLTLNLMADATKLGVAKTFLYQLNDYADPSGLVIDDHFGLFDQSFQPKLVATAIHNLTTILADPSANADNFATHALDYKLSGLPEGGNSLLLEKSSGLFDLMVWAEPDIWDQAADRPITVAATETIIDLGDQHADVRVYDPLVSDQPIATYYDVSSVTFATSDHPVIVEISLAEAAPLAATARFAAPLWLKGNAGDDVLTGGDGDDRLTGRAGDDILSGGAGNDMLIGGTGSDRMTGGSGADRFVFNVTTDSRALAAKWDHIMDFNRAEGDLIDLSGIDARAKEAGDQTFTLAGDQFTRHAGELIQTRQGDGMLVQGDVNGDGKADFQIMLHNIVQPLSTDAFIL